MAVTFDVASTGAGTSPSWSHTCDAAATLLIIQIGDFVAVDAEATSGITYNGVALSLLGSHAFNTSRTSLWYLVSPASGAHTIAVTSASAIACVASSWTGSNTSTPFGTPVTNTASSGQPASGSITGATTSMLVANTGNLTDDLTDAAGQDALGFSASGGFVCNASYKAGSGSATTLSWTGVVSDARWAVLAVEILSAPLYAEGSGFTIPNRSTAIDPALEEWTETDHRIKVVAGRGDGVITGCQVTAPTNGFYVDVQAGEIHLTDILATLAACRVIPTPADASSPRIDVLVAQILSSGAAHVYFVEGTPGWRPRPAPLPVDVIGLAFLLVPAGFTSITTNCIIDKRCWIVVSRAVIGTNLAAHTIVGSGTEVTNFAMIPMAGTIRNLYFRTSTSQGGSDNLHVTVQQNGVDTAVTVTVTAGAAAGIFSDLTHNFTVAAGDYLSLKLQNFGGTSAAVEEVSVEVDPS